MLDGKSPEGLSHAIYARGLGKISGQTIRRIEDKGVVPHVRHQFRLAAYFDRQVIDIWELPARERVAA